MAADDTRRGRLGIYVHVPFCRTRCRYCDFYRVGENRARMDSFLIALAEEIAELRAFGDRRVDSVFFGGGTPSLLDPEAIAGVLAQIGEALKMAPDCEISAEANPSDLTPARLDGYRRAGINRLSVGVQSFVDRELSLLGRRHDARRAADCLELAREIGFERLSLDLMVAIPGQTEASFRFSVDRAIELDPGHLSLYLLEVPPGSEMDGLLRRRPGLFPGEEAQRRRYLRLIRWLTAYGYSNYELSNFARPGQECRHNLKYWRCEDVVGLGPSAHSNVNGNRWRNPASLLAYLASPTTRERLPSRHLLDRAMLGLRLADGIPTRYLADLGIGPETIRRRLSRLGDLITAPDGRVRLTPVGRVVSSAVIAELLADP